MDAIDGTGRVSNNDDDLKVRRAKELDWHLRGKSYRWIAGELGLNVKTVFGDVKLAIQELLPIQDMAEMRAAEVARLDALLDTFTLLAEEGDDKAAAILIRVGERRAKLMGMDSPDRVDVKTTYAIEGLDPSADIT